MTSRNPLQIEITNTDDHYITVKNNIQTRLDEKDSTGYGLEALKKRYELMNIEEGILIEETVDYFTVQLKLIKV